MVIKKLEKYGDECTWKGFIFFEDGTLYEYGYDKDCGLERNGNKIIGMNYNIDGATLNWGELIKLYNNEDVTEKELKEVAPYGYSIKFQDGKIIFFEVGG